MQQNKVLFNKLWPIYNNVNKILSVGLDDVARLKMIQSLPSNKKNLDILDLFTGTGSNIPFLLDKFNQPNLTALDNSEGMLELAKKNFSIEEIRFILSDFLDFNFANKKFDLIVCSFGLKCITQSLYEDYFYKLYNILNPQGEIVFLDIFKSNKRWKNWLFQKYFKFILYIHPKVNHELRLDFLKLIEFTNQFSLKLFKTKISEVDSFRISEVNIKIPFIRAFKIIKDY